MKPSFRVALLALLSPAVMACSANAADTKTCDQACLTGVVDTYMTAMLAHNPAKAMLAKGARYTENGVELPLPDGLWRTLGSFETYRLLVADPKEGSVGFFVKAVENGAPVLVATRLKVVNKQITEIESVASRLAATIGGGPSSQPRVDQLGDTPRKQFLDTL